jgi:hypothetical protein
MIFRAAYPFPLCYNFLKERRIGRKRLAVKSAQTDFVFLSPAALAARHPRDFSRH